MNAEQLGRFARALQAAQVRFPNLRIGQIIENARYYMEQDAGAGTTDLFYLEDEDMIRSIEGFVEHAPGAILVRP